MSSISILHAPRDEALGDKIVTALATAGHAARRVASDSGDLHEDLAEGAAIVVWTEAAAKLARLRDQAMEVMARGSLIPVAVGGARPPGGFEQLPPVDLSGWTGAADDPRWRFVLEEIQLAHRRSLLRDGEVWAEADNDVADRHGAALDETALVSAPETFAPMPASSIAGAEEGAADADTDETYTEDLRPPRRQRPRGKRFSAKQVAWGATGGLVMMTVATAFLAPILLPRPEPAPVAQITPDRSTEASAQPLDKAAALPEQETTGPTAVETASVTDILDEGGVIAERGQLIIPPVTDVLPEEGEMLADKGAAALASEVLLASETIEIAGEETPAEDAIEAGGVPETPALKPAMAPRKASVADSEAMAKLIAQVTAGVPADAAAVLAAADGIAAARPEPAPPADPLAAASYPGNYFQDCSGCPDMAALPAGVFMMGAAPGEAQRVSAETPMRPVTIEKRFAIGAREVTFAEWDACVAEGACRASVSDHGWGRGARPVVSVSYEDALSFTRWLSNKTGKAYRLPTEAEWEYAARAGSSGPFAFGRAISTSEANYNGDYPYGGAKGVNRGETTPAASFPPNAFGLFDMHGNAWEWTADCWTPTHDGAPENAAAVGFGDCSKRVLKGGAWNTGGWRLRAAHRIGKSTAVREFDNGFRVARDLD